ncbi:diguanylate cyclase [Rhizobium sp.]|uniref:diguanylate cyclase n=1 Tax=Rhizobium sp. TaxID=391 RepID=UPI002AA8DDB2
MNSYLEQTSKAIAQHADDVIEVAKQPLVGLVIQARDNNKTVLQNLELVRTMRELVKKSSYVRSLAHVGADGLLIESTINNFSAGVDLKDRPYFQYHKNSEDPSPRVDGPFKGPVTNEWFISLSQRLSDHEGRFAGVMVATIDVKMFVRFFNGFALPGGGAFAMIDGNGRILLRSPVDEAAMGSSVADTPFFREAVVKHDSGNYEYRSPFDGSMKSSGYYKSKTSHITVLVAVPRNAVLRYWTSLSKTRWLFSLAAVLAALLMAIRLRRNWAMAQRDQLIIAAREAEFQLIANASSDLIEKLDDTGIREYVSAASQSVLGIDAKELVGRSILEGYEPEAQQYWSEALANIAAGSSIERLIFLKKKNSGEMAWLESVVTRVRSLDVGSGMVAVTRDVTSQRLLQEELDRLANTDELTQLFNKRHFNGQLANMAAQARAAGTRLSLLLIDVDKFKLFNDTYGHLPGDNCLRAIAAEIAGTLRPGMDVAARYGGEEMAVLLPGLGERDVRVVAESIRQRISALGIVHHKNLPWGHVTVSIGMAMLSPDRELSDESLFVKADQCLYRAKNSGRNKLVAEDADVGHSATAVA